MRLLLRAALRNRKHFSLLIVTFFTLIALTLANSLEIFGLGVLSNTGSDFFSLFSSHEQKMESVALQDVIQQWDQIDTHQTGVITKQEAKLYLSKQKDTNPLNWVLERLKSAFPMVGNIKALILILVGVAIFKAIWLFASRYTTQLLAIRISRDLRQQYFEHIQSLPMSFYHKHNIGSLSSRVVGDAGQIASSLNSCITNFLQSPFTIAANLGACFYLSWQLSLVIFVGLPFIVWPIVFLAKRVRKVSRQLQSNQEGFASALIDFLAGIQTVKIFAMEIFSLRKYKEQNDRMALLESKTAKYGLLTRPILHAVTTLCVAIVVLFGLYNLGMSVSQLLVFCGMLQLAYEPVKKFADENSNIQKGVVAAERMYEVLNIKPHIEDKKGAIELKDFAHSIEFDHVWFRYGEEWVLKDLSFTVEKGQTVALVGSTGAGKSTVVQLLPRLYDIERGEIRIDGVPLRHYTQKSLREQMAFVAQKPFMFLDTVAANIAFGRDFSRASIEESARCAHAHEFISDMPHGYDSMLAEAGQNLSGGQLQRLAIARALVKKAPILILDEATSALDSISEARIKAAVLGLHGSITQILIAHRLGTIEHADKIIFLEKGVKVAEGSRDYLLETCEPFRLMWEALTLTAYKGASTEAVAMTE